MPEQARPQWEFGRCLVDQIEIAICDDDPLAYAGFVGQHRTLARQMIHPRTVGDCDDSDFASISHACDPPR